MKGIRKLSITALLAVSLMTVGTTSAFAKYGWGDSINDPIVLFNSYTNVGEAAFPIDSTSEYDFYLIDNSSSSRTLSYSAMLFPPSGLNFDMQFIETDSSGNILRVWDTKDNGPGELDGGGSDLAAGHKMYLKIQSHGAYDYDSSRNYTLKLYYNYFR